MTYSGPERRKTPTGFALHTRGQRLFYMVAAAFLLCLVFLVVVLQQVADQSRTLTAYAFCTRGITLYTATGVYRDDLIGECDKESIETLKSGALLKVAAQNQYENAVRICAYVVLLPEPRPADLAALCPPKKPVAQGK